MIVNWLQNILGAILPDAPNAPNRIGQGAQTFEKKSKAKLINVTEGASLSEEARKRSVELLSMVRKGGVPIDRLRFWLQARRKVRSNLADAYDTSEIREEITEKILEVAKEDPFYKRLFS